MLSAPNTVYKIYTYCRGVIPPDTLCKVCNHLRGVIPLNLGPNTVCEIYSKLRGIISLVGDVLLYVVCVYVCMYMVIYANKWVIIGNGG